MVDLSDPALLFNGRDRTTVFAGTRPTHHGDLIIESHGMAPIPEDQRYGSSWRNFTVWFAPNMELSGVFTGTLAFTLGLGFWSGFAAIVIGVVLGAVPVGLLATLGPKTGMGQLPLARLSFGRRIALPAALQWLSALAWDGLVGLFGAQGVQLLFHVPFAVGALIVLALEGLVGFLGYEVIHCLETWGSAILAVLFVVLSVRIVHYGRIPLHSTVHGGDAIGAFVLMSTIAFSGAFSWASYAADYSRYQEKETPSWSIFWWTFGGLCASYIWTYAIGLAGASTEQSNSGGCPLPGGWGRSWHVGTRHRRLRGDHEQRHERLLRIARSAGFGSEAEAELGCSKRHDDRLRRDPLAPRRNHVSRASNPCCSLVRTGSLHFSQSSSSTGSIVRSVSPLTTSVPLWIRRT